MLISNRIVNTTLPFTHQEFCVNYLNLNNSYTISRNGDLNSTLLIRKFMFIEFLEVVFINITFLIVSTKKLFKFIRPFCIALCTHSMEFNLVTRYYMPVFRFRRYQR